ncbi:MAG: diaminopimelate decarboxylase, partial [Proteiniphilum sp.]
MIKGIFPTEKFKAFETPFYYYDMALLRDTLDTIRRETDGKPFHIHYAIKANANPEILRLI